MSGDPGATYLGNGGSPKGFTAGIDSAEVFVARHHAWGIATIPVGELLAAAGRLVSRAASGQASRHWVATVSACHGVLGQLALPPAMA